MPASLLLAAALTGQTPAAKPTLKVSDFGQWERLGPGVISDDGRWYGSVVSKVEGAFSLTLRSSDGPERWVTPQASGLQFTKDSRFALCTVQPAPGPGGRQSGPPASRPENRLLIRSLPSGAERVVESVASWALTKDGQVAVLGYAPPSPPAQPGQPPARPAARGVDFQLIDLASSKVTPVGNVAGMSYHQESGLIALAIDSPSGMNGIQILNPSTGQLKTIAWGKTDIAGMTWAAKADTIAWFEATEDQAKDGNWHVLKVAQKVSGTPEVKTLDPKSQTGFPAGSRIVEAGGLRLNDEGTIAAFGFSPWADRKPNTPRPPLPNVEIWHSKDVDVVPLQRSLAQMEMNRHSKAVWRIADGRMGVYAGPELDNVRLLPGFTRALAEDRKRHASPVKVNGIEYSDLWQVDAFSGKRMMLMEKTPGNVGSVGISSVFPSQTGRYVVYFQGRDWWLRDLESGKLSNLTASIPADFSDREDDRTLPMPAFAAGPVWLKDDAGLILANDFDLYKVHPRTGFAERLTFGEKDELRYRWLSLGENDKLPQLDLHYFTIFHTRTKQSGVARREKDGTVRTLLMMDRSVSQIRRSQDTDRVLFRMQSFEDSPNDFVTNLEFSAAKPLTRTNPQQANFAWGKAELVDYKIGNGTRLQGILYYPANYRSGEWYPMITYIYERLSDGLHRYQAPDHTNEYDLQRFVQNGYFVFQPDIVYRDRNPGLSAKECIEAGVNAVLAKNIGVDPARLGLTGHSWGGYQTVFLSTQSKLFSAYVAGAPLTELITMYSSYYWNWGQTNQVIFESSQGRFDVPFWEDMKSYMDNSPLFHAGKVTAPIMVEAGTVDGAVDWTQAQFWYSTLRRMGKNMVLLVYPNENHGLAQPANQRDYADRLNHFFDVYLKRARPEKWVTEGVPFIKLDEERLRSATGGRGG